MSAVLEVREPSAQYLEEAPPSLVLQFERLAGAPGGVARLRELILTLAVRGKLVSQETSDEPASALLQGICAEKERLIAEGRLKPDKASSAAIDQHPFEIPETWIWVPMCEVVEIVRGITFPASEKTKEAGPGRIACLRTANVQESIEWDDLLFVSRSFIGREDQLLKLHDIVISMANSRELVGKVALVDHIPHAESTFGGFLGVLRPWRIDPRYAMALLRSSYARSTLIDSSSQTTNIANISLGKLRPLPFPLPPLAEQARIVARVNELIQLCDALEAKGRLEAQQHARLLETLLGTLTDSTTPEELAANWQRVAEHFDLLLDRPEAVDVLEQTVLQLAVRGQLVPQDASDEPASVLLERIRDEKERLSATGKFRRDKPLSPLSDEDKGFALPTGWQWARMGDVVLASEAGWSPTCHATPRRQGKWGVLKVSAVSWGTFDANANKELPDDLVARPEYEVMPGDLLLSRANTEELVARSVVVCETPPQLMLSDKIIRLDVSSHVDRAFLSLANNAEHSRAFYVAHASGTSSSMKNVSREVVLSLPVALPPLAEQARIVARVTELRRLCADLRQRLTASQTTQSHLAEALVDSATT